MGFGAVQDAGEDSRVVLDGSLDSRVLDADATAPDTAVEDASVPDADGGVTGRLPLTETGIDLSGLVAYWSLDADGATDGTPFPAFPDETLVATLETADARDVAAPGKIGTAVDLDGTDDRLVAPDAPAFDISGPLSMTAWINMDRLPMGDDDFGIVGKEEAYTLEIETDTVCIDFVVFRVGGGFDELDPTDCALTVGGWHHLAATFDGTDLVVFQNGVEVGRMAFTGASVALSDLPVLIGHNTFRITRFMDGRIDEVTIWSRALTGAEVETIERLQRSDGGG